MKVYGGTPPDGGGASTNENTVADARPCPPGDVATPPGVNAGITVVVVDVDVVVVEVVVDVVWVTRTMPSGSLGDPEHRRDTAARRRTIGSSLRTDIRLAQCLSRRFI
jgi:hypothetical protein